jgi:hypothetical protein
MGQRRRLWRWIAGGLGTLLLIGLFAVWMLFQHIPDWYKPVRIPPARQQQVKNDAVATVDALSQALRDSRAPFEFRLTQDQLNAWLSERVALYPFSRDWVPPSVKDPVVLIEPGSVRIGVTYSDGGLNSVVSARLSAEARARSLFVRLEEVSGGSLRLPRGMIRRVLGAFDEQLRPERTSARRAGKRRPLPRPSQLLDGVELPNDVKLPDMPRFRVIGLKTEPGALVATLERVEPRPD